MVEQRPRRPKKSGFGTRGSTSVGLFKEETYERLAPSPKSRSTVADNVVRPTESNVVTADPVECLAQGLA